MYTSPPKPKPVAGAAPIVDEVKRNLGEIGNSVAAKDGTSSVFSYVTSGLGAAIASVTGHDPINPQQVSPYSYGIHIPRRKFTKCHIFRSPWNLLQRVMRFEFMSAYTDLYFAHRKRNS